MLVRHVLHLIMCWCPKTFRISLSGLLRKRASSYFASFTCTLFSIEPPLACMQYPPLNWRRSNRHNICHCFSPLESSLACVPMLTLSLVMKNSTLTPINAPLLQVLSVASLHLKPLLVLLVSLRGPKVQLYLEARSIRKTSILHRLSSRMSGLVIL